MKSKLCFQLLTACVALLLVLAASPARAQHVLPVPPSGGGAVPSQFTDCTAEALNVSGFVGSDGNVTIYNIPSTQGQIRVRVTCKDTNGATTRGESQLLTPIPGISLDIGALSFGTAAVTPIPKALTIAPSFIRLTAGTFQDLSVGASGPNQATLDVTRAAAGTVYRTSNPSVATVSADGRVTGVSPGTAILFALYEGVGGFATVNVLPAAVQSLSVVPSTVNISRQALFPAAPVQLQVTGNLGNNSSIDLTSSSSGATYASSNPGVALVTSEGLIIAQGAGTATITVTDSVSHVSTTVPVTVTQFTPAPTAAYNTPGYAYNVDIAGTLAYIADSTSLRIVDVGANGALVGQFTFGAGTNVRDVRLRGTLAAVALEAGGLSLLNVANPAVVQEHKRLSGFTVDDVWISGNTVYAVGGGVFRAYDVTTPTAPTLLGTLNIANARAVSGDATRKLAVVLSSASPAVLSVIQMTGALSAQWTVTTRSLPSPFGFGGEDIVLFGTSAYAACYRDGVFRVDVSDPNRLPPAASIPGTDGINPTGALGLAVANTSFGPLVAVADNLNVNAVPLFNARLDNFFNIVVCLSAGALGTCKFPNGNLPVRNDPDGTGIALGNGFGVQTVGGDGIQVFSSQPITDNLGRPPSVWITSPTQGTAIVANGLATITAVATDDTGIAAVDFFVDGTLVGTATTAPYSTTYVPPAQGSQGYVSFLTAVARDIGGNTAQSLPVQIQVSPPAGERTMSSGYYHACNVGSNGQITCWGENSLGQLGANNTTTPQLRPVPVFGINDATSIAGGGYHTCARRATGNVACWGNNDNGQLGNGTTTTTGVFAPVQVSGINDAVSVAAGGLHACARRATGQVACWGYNGNGQLGNGTTTSSTTPVTVSGINDAVEITAGDLHTCARRATGAMVCWGNNGNGQLGDGTTTSRSSPVAVSNMLNAAEISAGLLHTCARRATGQVSCWGNNSNGQLGNGTTTESHVPVNVLGLTNAAQLGVGGYHSCAKRATNALVCWGYGGNGALGNGAMPNAQTTFVDVAGQIDDYVNVGAGSLHTCGLSLSRGVECWGYNGDGELGTGTTTDSTIPVPVLF